ncbi:MAG TPA: RNA polymerase sigma factor [Steroidobacteraceae bacterium]|nr:RNA polymerase sigma factor [Steroidobacteraceae bacterium]
MKSDLSAEALRSAEASIVTLACAGDRHAFAELVRRRQGSIRSLLRRLCRDAALADDLAQETFMQAWRTIAGLRSARAFGAWLRQVAVTAWLRHQRGSEKFTSLEEAHEPTSLPAPSDAIDLDAALSVLHPRARLCLVLSYHEGMTHQEIAALTHMPVGTVKSDIVRATARCRALLSAYRSPS